MALIVGHIFGIEGSRVLGQKDLLFGGVVTAVSLTYNPWQVESWNVQCLVCFQGGSVQKVNPSRRRRRDREE